jgi:hypothetical protein
MNVDEKERHEGHGFIEEGIKMDLKKPGSGGVGCILLLQDV